ncbi:MAG: tRNA (adenosine(37)-N6)-threonylcarbamoyltransferase complex dimerization subunit type 1 TsaB [Phycisphaerae bacterium]|nr:tRNA (adenosine(37)-N6)-threonylcarbamoyltransferase complex dimerization subunit type 1 TsaB [Phycisphaerae bacterium]
MSRIALAIEMSQRHGSIAVGDNRGVQQSRAFASAGSNDEDTLMPAIDDLVRAAALTPQDLGAIIVSIGPGGFTGLRVAVTTAKLLAECLAIPLVGVPSALVAAAAASNSGPRIVALASKRDSSWFSVVEGDGASVRLRGTPQVVDATSAFKFFSDVRTLLADEYVPEPIVDLARRAGVLLEVPRFEAEACLDVGLAMLGREELADSAQLTPIYPREPEAVTLWRERHG